MFISLLKLPVVWNGERPEWRFLYLSRYVGALAQGSNSGEVPQMCPQSLVSLMLKTVPANPHETKQWLYPQVWGSGNPSQQKAIFLPWGKKVGEKTLWSWKPHLLSQGLEVKPAPLLSRKPTRTLQLLFQTWSDGQEKLNFKVWLCVLSDPNGLQNSLYDWGEIIVLFNISIEEYIDHVGKNPTLTANWNSSWLAEGAAPAVVAGKLVVKESLGKDWHRWWA